MQAIPGLPAAVQRLRACPAEGPGVRAIKSGLTSVDGLEWSFLAFDIIADQETDRMGWWEGQKQAACNHWCGSRGAAAWYPGQVQTPQ